MGSSMKASRRIRKVASAGQEMARGQGRLLCLFQSSSAEASQATAHGFDDSVMRPDYETRIQAFSRMLRRRSSLDRTYSIRVGNCESTTPLFSSCSVSRKLLRPFQACWMSLTVLDEGHIEPGYGVHGRHDTPLRITLQPHCF